MSFSAGLVLCQDLKGCLKGPSFSWQSKVLPLGFGEEYISSSPRQKGKLSSPVTPNNVEHEAVRKIQNDNTYFAVAVTITDIHCFQANFSICSITNQIKVNARHPF